MFQFYVRNLRMADRLRYITEANPTHTYTHEELDNLGIPKYGLSCMWTQRSVDVCCGLPFNIASYALLTHIIAREVNMMPDVLIGSLGDCHIYKNHIDGVREQLGRSGYDDLPILKIMGGGSFEDLTADDIHIIDYECDPPIKFQLNVG
jgi:thymidylate synthase